MPWNVEANAPLARLLHRRLVEEKKPSLRTVARRTGIAESTLRGWCNGQSAIPLWALPGIASAIGDLPFFVEATGARDIGIRCDVEHPVATDTDKVRDLIPVSTHAAASAGLTASDALSDGVIDQVELREVQTEIDQGVRLLQRVGKAVKRLWALQQKRNAG